MSRTTLSACVLIAVVHLIRGEEISQRVKRQAFTQGAYSFSPSTCTPGTLAGSTSAAGAGYYSIANTSPSTYIAVNSNNGQIFLINYMTPNVPQTVTVNSYLSSTAYQQGTVRSSATVTVTCGTASGGGGSPPFPVQSAYTFNVASCTGAQVVGQVSATNMNGVTFTSSSGSIAVSSNGVVSLTSAAPAGTQTVQVTATNAYGSRTFPVTINCQTGTGSGGTGGTGVTFPTFSQSLYTFSPSICTAGSTVGSVSVNSPTGTTYALATPMPGVSVSPTGVITFIGSPLYSSSSVLSFAVTATNSAGTSATTVTVRPTCSTGGTGGTTTPIQFPVSSYSFVPTGTTCTAGSVVGQVAVVPATTGVIYSLASASGGYTINSAGQIIAPATGATSTVMQVMASVNGATTTTSVSIVATYCSNTPTTSSCPVYAQTSYAFTAPTGCSMFVTAFPVPATCIGGSVTYSLANQATNNFGIYPDTGVLYAVQTNAACNVLSVTAKSQATGRTVTVPVYVDCRAGATPGTCNANTAAGACTSPGAPGCGDIG